MAITKGHFCFEFLEFEIFFSKNVAVVSRKAVEFESPGQNFSEMSFVIYSRKTGKCWTLTRNSVGG